MLLGTCSKSVFKSNSCPHLISFCPERKLKGKASKCRITRPLIAARQTPQTLDLMLRQKGRLWKEKGKDLLTFLQPIQVPAILKDLLEKRLKGVSGLRNQNPCPCPCQHVLWCHPSSVHVGEASWMQFLTFLQDKNLTQSTFNPLSLPVLLPPLPQGPLSFGCKDVLYVRWLGLGASTLHFDQLYFSVMVSICYKKNEILSGYSTDLWL